MGSCTRRDGIESAEIHGINVTPFIDVMLVLLIIFMVATPLATVDVAVDLPAATAKPLPRPDKPIFLTITADRSLALGNDPVNKDSLPLRLDQASGGNKDQRIFLRADKSVSYETLMQVMNDCVRPVISKLLLLASTKPLPPSDRCCRPFARPKL